MKYRVMYSFYPPAAYYLQSGSRDSSRLSIWIASKFHYLCRKITRKNEPPKQDRMAVFHGADGLTQVKKLSHT